LISILAYLRSTIEGSLWVALLLGLALFRALGQPIVTFSDVEHGAFCLRVIHLFRESACLFCAFPPMVFVVDKPVHGFAPHCSATTPRHPVFSIALSVSALQHTPGDRR